MAPEFTLENQDGEEVSLEDFAGQRVILYFYPKDDTPGCTTEGRDFSALKGEFEEHNTAVFGISKDTVDSHKKFCNKYKFSIDLLSDEDGSVVEEYDAWREVSNSGRKQMAIVRSTVFIDEKGRVRKHWKNVESYGHAQQVLDFVAGQ